MADVNFNPFESRACRDVRNHLGSALLKAIARQSPDAVTAMAADIDTAPLSPSVTAYIRDRLSRYEAVMGMMKSKKYFSKDLYPIAGLLWDEGLFFECHEWLEQGFAGLHGRDRDLRQALIRTAGTFELLAYGRTGPAVSTAAKALAVLEIYQEQIPEAFHIQPKIKRLKAVVAAHGRP